MTELIIDDIIRPSTTIGFLGEEGNSCTFRIINKHIFAIYAMRMLGCCRAFPKSEK